MIGKGTGPTDQSVPEMTRRSTGTSPEVCMKRVLALTAIAFLAACGADGAPQAPAASASPPPPGLTLSGDAYIGVVSN
jgi:hypothetical protein